MSARRELGDDSGQVLPILAVVVAVLSIGAFYLAEVGIAGGLRAGGQSAADAAALAAASELRHQAEEALLVGSGGGPLDLLRPDHAPLHSRAADYAERNGARLVPGTFQAFLREVRLEVETLTAMTSRRASDLGVDGERGEAAARARFRLDWRAARPEPRNRTTPHSEGEIRSIMERNDISCDPPPAGPDEEGEEDAEDEENGEEAEPQPEPVCPPTALQINRRCQHGGPDVVNLVEEMKDAVVRLEHAPRGLGGTVLPITSAYRHPGCGAAAGHGQGLELYSPENYGHAFRVAGSHIAAVATRSSDPAFLICQPYPLHDPALFAWRHSDICAGQTGPLTPQQAFGGNLDAIVRFEVELIPDEGALGLST